ncbi:hypothetical protein [Nocardioides sp.]|uniref:hypothetical protein n=1 Tax=Nocardioides sp. TaxID=35761 RepID=UPI002C613301|nr:hypothetical protein [Nocardioides sp.]HXH79784.1 hypothetical protein [Nocardioides sp.]
MTLLGTPAGSVRRLVAAILVMAATSAVLVGVSSPATAAACSTSSGVSVVVDFSGVTSGLRSACVAGGADQPASDVVAAAGFRVDYVQRQPGFLCRIDGVPASDPCVNTPPSNAYWGLFWSDGKDGVWHYSDFGVTSLQVPDGGYIGLAWQSGTRRVPGQAATAHAVEEPSPTATPSPTPSGTPTTGPSPTQPSSSGTTSPSPSRSPKPTGTGTPGPTGTTAGGSPAPTTGTAPAAPSDSASPSAQGSEAATEQPSAAGSGTPSPGAKKSAAAADPVESDSASSAPSSTATESVADPVAPSAAESESRRVPTWVSLGILVLLLVSIGIAAMAARRRTQP